MEFAVTLYNICRSFPRPFVKKEKKIWDFYQNHGNTEPAAPPAPAKTNVMCPVRTVQFQRTNWAKNNQLQPITYEFCIAV